MLGINFGFAVVLAIIFASLFGYGMNIFVYKQLRKRKASSVILLIASFALLILLESLILILFGADVKTIGFIKIAKGKEIFGAIITPLQMFIIACSFALLLFLFFFMKKTKVGKAMRAVADNKDVVEIEAGDTPLHPEIKRLDKSEKEKKAMELLHKELPTPLNDKFLKLFTEFEEQKTLESKFAKAIDALDAEIHELDYKQDWKGWSEEFLVTKKLKFFEEFPELKKVFFEILDYLKENNYFDQ